jgi:septal ring factor EnvC (AmiA/AmiB activator)
MKAVALILAFSMFGCATRPRTYVAPDSSRLEASTTKVAVAVAKAHTAAQKAQQNVSDASKEAKEIREETAKIENVPQSLVVKVNDLDGKLDEALSNHAELTARLEEADQAKADVEKDKADYIQRADALAQQATSENSSRVADEKKLSWYRWHWWGSWIVLGAGVVLCVVLGIAKFVAKMYFP